MTRQNKLLLLVNTRVRINLNDGRTIVGQLLAFDKFMNLVVADGEEYRRVKTKRPRSDVHEALNDDQATTMRRTLGLIVLRGEIIVSCSQEAGPPSSGFDNKARVPAAQQMMPGMRPTAAASSVGTMPAPMPPAAMMMRPGMMVNPIAPPGMRQ